MFNTPVSPFQYWRSQLWQFIRSRSMLTTLILINVAVWLTLAVSDTTLYLSTLLFNNPIRLKPYISQYLGYSASYRMMLYHPWAIVTSLFVHSSFWHMLCNMLILGIVGRIYLQYKSGKSLLATYLIGGACGNLLFQAAFNIFPALCPHTAEAFIVGSSGAVMAIMIAITLCQPNHPIRLMLLGQIRLKWLALICIGIMAMPLLNSDFSNIGGHFAHLGGALYGAGAALWMLYGRKLFSSKPKQKRKKFYTSYQAGTPEPEPKRNQDDEKRVEEILSKIAKDGYGALSKEEKDFLYHYKK